jgi:hypothetical protein
MFSRDREISLSEADGFHVWVGDMWTISELHGKRRQNFDFRSVCLSLVCVCLLNAALAMAQTELPVRDSLSSSRLLTVEEGRSIVNVAWRQDRPAPGVRDCSHLVHQIYANAGFEYAYASSFEIYAGNENFERVRNPHPGDLIAWPGHVGIVVDPLEHSFYSLVRTGLEAQDYRSAYWRSRGTPRFYRYRVEQGASTSAANISGSSTVFTSSAKRSVAMKAQPIIKERAAAEHDSSDRPPAAALSKAEVIYGSTAPVVPSVAQSANAAFAIPGSVIVATGNRPPTVEEVADAISEMSDASGSLLGINNPLKTLLPTVIVEEFKVERLDIKRDHGSARLEVDSKVVIDAGEIKHKERHEKVRWELRRTESGWEAVKPKDRTYIPHDIAVKNLADQPARLANSNGAAQHQPEVVQEESQLASLLSVLLQNR